MPQEWRIGPTPTSTWPQRPKPGSPERRGFKKNQCFADNGPVTYHVFSAELEIATAQEIVVKISLRLTGEDDPSSIHDTYFVSGDDPSNHRFGQEEYDLGMSDAPYEEFDSSRRNSRVNGAHTLPCLPSLVSVLARVNEPWG